MARTGKRSKPKTRFYRCTKCRAPIPTGYKACGACGYAGDPVDEFIRKAVHMFPGSREL